MLPVYVSFFNIVFDTGIIPESSLEGVIWPIYKNNGDPKLPENYRPISILICFGKLFTAILNSRLNNILQHHNILEDTQTGFRAGYSTTDHIFTLYVLTEILKSKSKSTKDRWWHFNYINSRFQLHEFTISASRIHEFNFTNSRFQLHEFNFTNSTSRIHEFHFTNSRIQLHEFTNSTSRIQLHEFHFMNSRIQLHEFTNSTSRIQLLNSWSWIREVEFVNSWSGIREVEFVNSWSWIREFA